MRRIQKVTRLSLPVDSISRTVIDVMTKPEMTKNTSTPTKPLAKRLGPEVEGYNGKNCCGAKKLNVDANGLCRGGHSVFTVPRRFWRASN
jgi:hypothetical protein